MATRTTVIHSAVPPLGPLNSDQKSADAAVLRAKPGDGRQRLEMVISAIPRCGGSDAVRRQLILQNSLRSVVMFTLAEAE